MLFFLGLGRSNGFGANLMGNARVGFCHVPGAQVPGQPSWNPGRFMIDRKALARWPWPTLAALGRFRRFLGAVGTVFFAVHRFTEVVDARSC